jgi:FtsZ-binding cell division protein ZapB
MIHGKLVSEVGFKTDAILQVVLEQLKELKKDMSASQELRKDICTSQEELKSEISDINAAQSEFKETITDVLDGQLKGVCFGNG